MRIDAPAQGLGAVTLFVEDVHTVQAFYRDVLGLRAVFEDDVSTVFALGGTMLNVLAVTAAAEVVAPAPPAAVGHTPRMLLSLWVEDVDATCRDLQERGVVLLTAGPAATRSQRFDLQGGRPPPSPHASRCCCARCGGCGRCRSRRCRDGRGSTQRVRRDGQGPLRVWRDLCRGR